MTRPYGWIRCAWRDEDFGPPSRYVNGKYGSRHRERQLMHKQGRRQGHDEIEFQLADWHERPDLSVCCFCGLVCDISEIDALTGGCIYC